MSVYTSIHMKNECFTSEWKAPLYNGLKVCCPWFHCNELTLIWHLTHASVVCGGSPVIQVLKQVAFQFKSNSDSGCFALIPIQGASLQINYHEGSISCNFGVNTFESVPLCYTLQFTWSHDHYTEMFYCTWHSQEHCCIMKVHWSIKYVLSIHRTDIMKPPL